MRWPWRHRSSPSPEAVEAERQADRAMVDAERRDDAARDVEARLRAVQANNNIAAAVRRSIQGGRA